MSIREDLKAFVDGELSPERAAEVQAAIDQDPALRDEVLFMKILSGEIKDASREPQATGADKAVERAARPRYTTWRWAAYAASGVTALFLIGFVGSKIAPIGGWASDERAGSATPASLNKPAYAAPMSKGPSEIDALQSASKSAPTSDGDVAKATAPGGGIAGGAGSITGGPSGGSPTTPYPQSSIYGSEGAPGRGESMDAPAGAAGDGVVAKSELPEAESSTEAGKTADVQGRFRDEARTPKAKTLRDKSAAAGAYRPAPSDPFSGVEPARKVMRNADMGVKVKDVRKSVSEVERQVNAMNGFVGDTRYDGRQDSSTATMQFEVPEKNFVAMLDSLRRMGTVEHENVTGQDVTANIADGKGRITALADEEQNLIMELQRARQSDVRLEIRRRLSSVRQEISGLKAQTKALEGLAEMSRVSLTLNQSGQLDESNPNDWFGQTTRGAGDLLGFFGRFIGVGVIYLVFMAPIWLPITGVVWWLRHRSKANAAGNGADVK